jgi:D-alanine--poly(phosphoribitol) ligase subunit 1
MEIRQLIQRRLESTIHVFDREGTLIPEGQVKAEYKKIRQYLLDHHSSSLDCIAIKQSKDYRYLLTMLACMEIGIPYIPMKHDYPEDRMLQIQADSKFSLVVDDNKMNDLLNYQGEKVKDLPNLSSDQAMYIIFTSGSTGRPKGVIIQRKALENFFKYIYNTFPNVTEKDKLLQVTEFTFDISLVDVAFFLLRNVNIHFSNFENNIFKLGYEVETHKINILNTVPNNLNMFLSDFVADRMDYKCLKYLLIAGSRFSYGLYQKCIKYFDPSVEVHNLYGPTEGTVYSHGKKLSYNEAADLSEGNVSIGTPLPGLTAHVVHDGGIAPPHVRGELYISGIQLMKEYVNNPEQTKNALIEFNGETFYKTGDLSFRNEVNEFFIVGRTDDTIKYRGFRINLLDIDSYIMRVPYIQDSITIAVPHEATENQTIGFLILKEDVTVKKIKEDLAALLLDYQIPEKLIFVKNYPTNISGKICKKTLKEDYLKSTTKV